MSGCNGSLFVSVNGKTYFAHSSITRAIPKLLVSCNLLSEWQLERRIFLSNQSCVVHPGSRSWLELDPYLSVPHEMSNGVTHSEHIPLTIEMNVHPTTSLSFPWSSLQQNGNSMLQLLRRRKWATEVSLTGKRQKKRQILEREHAKERRCKRTVTRWSLREK